MNLKKLLFNIGTPLVLGLIVSLISSSFQNYSNFVLPDFAPPGILFPIVWTILYILMGISSYIISESDSYMKNKTLFIYRLQLIVNLLWTIIFFVFNFKVLAFIWILLLVVLVIIMLNRFYAISKTASFLQIPYLFWISFASILTLSIIILN